MTKRRTVSTIDEYFRERLRPVESAISHIPGIEMFGALQISVMISAAMPKMLLPWMFGFFRLIVVRLKIGGPTMVQAIGSSPY